MKKAGCVVLAGLFLVVFSVFAKAEDVVQQQETAGGMMEQTAGIMKHDMLKDSTKKKMFRAMMVKNMIATEDGGVIVLVGNKLQKYDKELVLQKETEIQIDLEDMKNMRQDCPMRSAGLKVENETPALEVEGHEETGK